MNINEYLVKNKLEGRPMNFDGYQNIANTRYNEFNYNFNSAQSGYTNAIIICMNMKNNMNKYPYIVIIKI